MVILNPATLSRKSLRLLQWAAFYRTPTKHFNTQIKIPYHSLVHNNWSSASCHRALPSTLGFKAICRPEYGFGHSGLRSFQVSSGGVGGGFGGSGDGSTGGGGGGGSNDGGGSPSNWYLSLLAKYPVMTKAITSAFLTLVGDLICQVLPMSL